VRQYVVSVDLGLSGRAVIVTGGSSGVGLATVERLVAEGASVGTCARDADRLRRAVAHLDHEAVLAVPYDVEDTVQCDALVEATASRYGRIDGLVNNAGRGRHGRLHELTDADWRAELNAKIFGTLNPTRAAIPHLSQSDAPRIVNISAVTAREPRADLLAVSAARAALSNLSRALATELAPSGILVNTVSLGVIATDRASERHQRQAPALSFEEWAKGESADRGVQLRRLGQPEEAAVAIAFLVSPLASYITGAILEVSGGLTHAW
jgi:NAD(P)-dependent dehydrogenase (short-subunit alcohol dehydrogenase family)